MKRDTGEVFDRYDWQCAQNYHLLHHLLPSELEKDTVLQVGSNKKGQIQGYVLQNRGYTDIVCLVTSIVSWLPWLKQNIIELSLYHDVKLAEITGLEPDFAHNIDESVNWSTLVFKRNLEFHQKAQLNLLLFETLNHLKS